MSRLLSILIVALLLSSTLVIPQPVPVSAKGRILEVGADKPYKTIQRAVNDAMRGDTILVYAGRYEESVEVTKNHLKIIARDGGVTVYSPKGNVAAFTIYADYVVIRGFDELTGIEDCTPGIRFKGSHNTFAENVINPGSCPGVNALVCRDPDGGSNFNRIENNTVVHGDLGIVVESDSADALNIGNTIRNNTLNRISMTGIAVTNGRGFDISGNTIPGTGFGHCITVVAFNNIPQGNHHIANNNLQNCAGYGIALWADNSTTLTDNHIYRNEVSESNIGINLYADPYATASHNLIQDNTIYLNNDGVHLEPGTDNNLILNNLVETNHRMGIVISSDNNKVVKNSTLSNATIGINVDGNNNLIIKNKALDNGEWDLADYGMDNTWLVNKYGTASWE